ncbi:bZIP transcription factor 23-like [Magnolia sinica]|uniref:bZIP transcription factor 23-like n=1 Tax=Magnolia sinica TaxID=86752 RepID=UPI002659CB93|nr:bZIP transcription factor 23-like [Magnolia sinica]
MFPTFHSFEEYKKTIQLSISPYSFSLHSLHLQNQMVITNHVVEHPMSSVPLAGPTTTTSWENPIGTDRDNAMRFDLQNAGSRTRALAAGQQYQFHGSGNAAENVSGSFGGGNGGFGLVPQHAFQPLDGFDGGVCKEGGRNQQKQRSENGVDAVTSAEKKRNRMIKNRASAARSRARKQAYTTQLEIEVAQLQKENELLRKRKKVFKDAELGELTKSRKMAPKTLSAAF